MAFTFDENLTLIEEGSTRLRAAVLAAHGLDAEVPGCRDWTVRDLVVHVGQVQHYWAQVVRAGRTEVEWDDDVSAPATAAALLEWSAETTSQLTDALRDVGPDAPCLTWWERSDAPSTSGAVARHQVQEAAVHAYDAQTAAGDAEQLPSQVAVDCVDEFLVVSFGAMGAWPHADARVRFVAAEGRAWTLELVPTGAKLAADNTAAATVSGIASDVLLALYSRIPVEQLQVTGDRQAVQHLFAWAQLSTQ